jgi:hypothetical protein
MDFYFGLLRDFLFLLKCEPLYGYTFGHNLHLLLSLFHRPFTSYLLTPPGEQSSRSYFDFKFTPNSVSDLIFGLLISGISSCLTSYINILVFLSFYQILANKILVDLVFLLFLHLISYINTLPIFMTDYKINEFLKFLSLQNNRNSIINGVGNPMSTMDRSLLEL